MPPPEDDLPEGAVRLPIRRELDLHTFLPRDIPSLVPDWIDEAWKAGLRDLRIVHGRGMGYQRRVVQEILSRHPAVESFADDHQARQGATFVRLRPRG